MKPSRTFTIAMWAITAILLVALAGLGLIALVVLVAPEHLSYVLEQAPVVGTISLAIAGAGGAGSGAMGLRDWGSGGLTSSSASAVLAARRSAPRPPAVGAGVADGDPEP